MKYLFYSMIVLPILWESMCILNLDKVWNFRKGLVKNKKDGVKYNDFTSNQKNLSVLMLLYFSWAIIGLFTFNWVLFVMLLLISFIPRQNKIIHFINSLITLIILIFMILNAFHFHIDLLDLLINDN